MKRNIPLSKRSHSGIYKERREFDFLDFVFNYLKRKTDDNTITRPLFFKYVCSKFSLPKSEGKKILRDLEESGMIMNTKREILLLGDQYG